MRRFSWRFRFYDKSLIYGLCASFPDFEEYRLSTGRGRKAKDAVKHGQFGQNLDQLSQFVELINQT